MMYNCRDIKGITSLRFAQLGGSGQIAGSSFKHFVPNSKEIWPFMVRNIGIMAVLYCVLSIESRIGALVKVVTIKRADLN